MWGQIVPEVGRQDMERIARLMMDLIAGEVCGKETDRSGDVFPNEELAKLYSLAKAQDLAHLVGNALLKRNRIENEEIRAKFQKQVMLAVYRYEKIHYELERLRSVLNEAEIPFLPLKGSVLRQYYPEPWMRTSCDIDILVRKNDLERAVAVLVGRAGCREDSNGSHDVGLFTDGGVHIELHYSLIEEKCVGNIERVLAAVWENASPVAGTAEYVLSDEMFYVYHIAHMAKHFVDTGGCGVRPFLDIWILNHRVSFDREKRNALLAEGGLLTFASESENLSEAWFGNGEFTEITRRMQDYLLRGGVYGNAQNRIAVGQVKRGGKVRYAFSRIWLPYEVLKFHYPSLEGKRILLPLYEVRRWCKLLFCGGTGRSIKELMLNSGMTREEQKNALELLEKLNLEG